jgi:hypothetical protein
VQPAPEVPGEAKKIAPPPPAPPPPKAKAPPPPPPPPKDAKPEPPTPPKKKPAAPPAPLLAAKVTCCHCLPEKPLKSMSIHMPKEVIGWAILQLNRPSWAEDTQGFSTSFH